MMILVLNSGSSSVKYQLFNMDSGEVLASGLVERIAESVGAIKHKRWPGTQKEESFSAEMPVADHKAALMLVVDRLIGSETGVIADASEIKAIGHRIVQGGAYFSAPTLVDDSVVEKLREIIPIGPLHNPGHIAGIETAKVLFPGVPQVVVIDTAFHQTMPPEAYLYPLPYDLCKELRIRRYGFHGTSHAYVAGKAAEFLGRKMEETSVITIHLGNGCSMDAVKRGRCVDTSMGLTPLAGLMMGTRCGDIDPAILPFLAANKGLSMQELDTLMNKESGLKGICGVNDMRDIHARRKAGDERAELAFRMFCYRVKHYIGAYLAVMGECEAIVFTAGIGENDSEARAQACAGLEFLGIVMDEKANASAPRGRECEISAPGSRIKVLVVPTNEELAIAKQTEAVIKALGT